jgi:chaperonin GroES
MGKVNLRPLGDHLIIKAIKEDERTKAGIVLPQTAEDKPERGEVIAVGPGKLLENGQRAPMSVKVGDKVVFKKYSPDEIKIDQEEYLIISEDDVLAVFD